jgi:adenylate cyclase
MRCQVCNSAISGDDVVCPGCGASPVRSCRQCGHPATPNARFCVNCGTPLRAGAPRADLLALGERKQATVLFADIVGSTGLIAGLDPEQAMDRLRPAVTAMCAAVERHFGSVIRTLGDGIMAIFGAPHAREAHALLACQSALAMQEAFRPGSPIAIRVGLHSGEVVSGVLKLDQVKEQEAHGLTVHLASHLQQIATPGGIWITEDCCRLVRPYCQVRPLGPHLVKGFQEPFELYALLGLRSPVTAPQFRGGQGLTSFRGRDPELAVLREAILGAADGNARVVGISAMPGAGKSRLCHEFARWCRAQGVPVLEARALIYGHATPFRPVLQFLRAWFQILPGDTDAIARRRIGHRLLALDPGFAADLPIFHEFLGVADPADPAPRLDPKARHARLRDILRRIILAQGTATSVLIIEDLHWLDEASNEFITTLVDAIAGTKMMLVVNYRPGYSAEWMRRPHFQELPLPELSPADTDAMLDELVGEHPRLRDIRRSVARRSAGNPFFAEELVRSLAEKAVISGEQGSYVPGIRHGDDILPPTVQAVLGARIDRLGEPHKTLLQIGAIIGKEFPLAVLEQVAGAWVGDIETSLGVLCDAGLLQEQSGSGGAGFAFVHPLTQEVAYATQLRARRSALHADVAEAIEAFHGDRTDEFAGLLAHHYEAAGRLAEAASQAARAARWVGTTDPTQAIKHWHQVRVMLQTLERSPASDPLRAMASGQIAMLGWREGMPAEEARSFIEEALGWARELDPSMVQLLLATDGRITVASGGPADAYIARLHEALALDPEGIDLGRVATLNAVLSHACNMAGLLERALAASDRALVHAARIAQSDHQFVGFNLGHWVRSLRGRILVRLGRFAEARRQMDEMLRIEPDLIDPAIQFIPHFGYVELAWCEGDAALAEEHASHVAAIARRSGIGYLRVYARAFSGTAKAIAGNFEAAAVEFAAGLEFARAAKVALEYEPDMLAGLADCHYRLGEFEQAIAVARAAIAIAAARTTRLPECHASITCAAAMISCPDAADHGHHVALLRRADKLIHESGTPIYDALLRDELARARAVAPRLSRAPEA